MSPRKLLTYAYACTIFAPSPAIAAGASHIQISLFGGVNATQVTITDTTSSATSNGYNGATLGAGIAYLPRAFLAVEIDGFMTDRVFEFNSTKGEFKTLQIPATAQLRISKFNVGAGMYSALWKYDGKMTQNGVTTTASANNSGNTSNELGFLALAAFKQEVYRIPLRFELRRFQSTNDLATASNIKGSLVEYQFLIGYDFGEGSSKSSSNAD